MAFDPVLAAFRFGTGLSPRHAAPESVEALILDLAGPDQMAVRFPIPGFDTVTPSYLELVEAGREQRAARGTETEQEMRRAFRQMRRQARQVLIEAHMTTIVRGMRSRFGLRERLTAFWADHFTVRSRAANQQHLVSPFVEDAIRPHVTGRFPDMLKAVVTHPVMLLYLEQYRSTGPGSPVAERTGRGLNENLARELLELHLLGVDGRYSQDDVRELAELLTGLGYQPPRGFYYNPNMAEPGTETVLGLSFGEEAALETVLDAVERLALLPETAAHLARKMAVHFVSNDPAPAMVEAMTRAYLDGGGDLMAMTSAMLISEAAWDTQLEKVRLPQEFITAAFRALDVAPEALVSLRPGPYQQLFTGPLQVMGQPWQRPVGPDGWSEDPTDWIIPQAMAGRIGWAMTVPAELTSALPDPRDFVFTALGPEAPQEAIFAAGAAETVPEGIGVVLASAAFNRR